MLEIVTQVQQQRPRSPTVTLTWYACKYKVHKLHQKYILYLLRVDFAQAFWASFCFKFVTIHRFNDWLTKKKKKKMGDRLSVPTNSLRAHITSKTPVSVRTSHCFSSQQVFVPHQSSHFDSSIYRHQG